MRKDFLKYSSIGPAFLYLESIISLFTPGIRHWFSLVFTCNLLLAQPFYTRKPSLVQPNYTWNPSWVQPCFTWNSPLVQPFHTWNPILVHPNYTRNRKFGTYSQKRNCEVSLSIYTFKCLLAIYIFPVSICLCGPILGIYKSLTDTWMWILGLRPRNSFLGIHKWDFRCTAVQPFYTWNRSLVQPFYTWNPSLVQPFNTWNPS
jgi:hypothetical protein